MTQRVAAAAFLGLLLAGCGGGQHVATISSQGQGPPPPPPSSSISDPSDSGETAPALGSPLRLAGFGRWRLVREPALMFARKVHTTSVYFRLNRIIDPRRYSAVIELNGTALPPQAEGRGWELRAPGNCYFAGAGSEGTTHRRDGDLVRLTVRVYRIRDHRMLARTSSAARLHGPLVQEDEPDNRWLHALGCSDSGYSAP
jgi:hypothetical protein